MPELQELLETMARALVDTPDEVRITSVRVDGDTIYTVQVGPNDLGQILGKDGRIANALRTLAHAIANKRRAKREKGRLFVEFVA